ncbi:MAG: hypothetical protein ACOCUV_02770 [bacterium]
MKLLGHDKVVIRFISLYILGLVLFFISWTLTYFLVPEGVLREFGFFTELAGDTAADTLGLETMKIFGINFIGMLLIVGGNYILRVKSFSYGYLVALAWMIMYGAILGTNSFAIPLKETMAPTIAVFSRSGLYEMMAGVLLAVATDSISINKSESFFSNSKPVPKNKRTPIKKDQWIAIGISILLLFGSALREAYMIVNL